MQPHRRIRGIVIVAAIALAAPVTHTQSSYRGLTPGTSTRQDVRRVLGNQVQDAGADSDSYPASEGLSSVRVDYTPDGVIRRIKLTFDQPVTRRTLAASFGLPATDGHRRTGPGWLMEFFAAPALLGFSYASDTTESGVKALEHFDAASFASASGLPMPATTTQPPPQPPPLPPPNYPVTPPTQPQTPPQTPNTPYNVGVAIGQALGALLKRGGNQWNVNQQASLDGQRLTYYAVQTPEQCQVDCARNSNCAGYTLIRAGAYNAADPPMCYLMSSVTKVNSSSCCISGVKAQK